jgi:glutamate-ammonia-ligase adenylyltransferase
MLDQFTHKAIDALWGDAHEARSLLLSVGLVDHQAAQRGLRNLARMLGHDATFAQMMPTLLTYLGHTASPDRALANLERLAESAEDPLALCRSLAAEPHLLELLVTVFAASQFLAEIVLRNPTLVSLLGKTRDLANAQDAQHYDKELRTLTAPALTPAERLAVLRRYQQRELLRLGTADLLGLLDLPTVTTQLSYLANALVRACLDIAASQTRTSLDGFAVIALGKLGGGELNYSSDVDLLLLSQGEGWGYRHLAETLIDGLARVTAEGFLYRVDMRLRAWGSCGPLVSSAGSYLQYLQTHARQWEKQALLKARAIAGDIPFGKGLLKQAVPLLYSASQEDVRVDVRDAKRRIEAQLCERDREWAEVKLGKGSIRDVEFVTQYLQLVHGGKHPEIRSRNTLRGLGHLLAHGLISTGDYRVLADGYTFLRPVEHYLQLVQNRQTHTLPADPSDLDYLARRLGFGGASPGAEFLARYQQHMAAIRAVYQRHLEGEVVNDSEDTPRLSYVPDVQSHIARMAPSYATVFSHAEIRRHAELAERLDQAHLVEVEAEARGDGSWRVTIVGYDYTGALALICGLLFAYGFSIQDGQVFTYEAEEALHLPKAKQSLAKARPARRRKIVDVFNVRPVRVAEPEAVWARYASDLHSHIHRLAAGEQRQAYGELAKRVALAMGELPIVYTHLPPVSIEIDNESSDRYTVLHIDALDTIGFLYEVTSALALGGFYIARVIVDSVGNRVRDTLYLTDRNGYKVLSAEKQRELRATTVLVKHFTHLLPSSPNPESALLHFHEFLGELFSRPDWPDELSSLHRPEVLQALARLLGVSEFLWDDFLRMQHANLFPVVQDVDALAAAKPASVLQEQLGAELTSAPDGAARREVLNAFKDREMFRIDMRHILGHTSEFGQFSEELADLAETIVEAAWRLCDHELRAEYGAPLLEDGRPCPLCICALGKLGGRELGFASDIELVFVFAGNGDTSGPHVISTYEYYERLVVAVTQAIHARREGIFQIDLRLRPYGSAGSLAVSLDSFRRYFAPAGPAWPYERQALVKLRPIVGDQALGDELLAMRDAFVYVGGSFDVAAMRAMRERQMRHLVAAGTTNAKFSPGGLVDMEYLVQGLQVRHGGHEPSLRLTNTSQAIEALAKTGVLSPIDYEGLKSAQVFLRQLIDALRMVRGNAKDLTVPAQDSEEFAFLARRLGYADDVGRLSQDLEHHTLRIQQLGSLLDDSA